MNEAFERKTEKIVLRYDEVIQTAFEITSRNSESRFLKASEILQSSIKIENDKEPRKKLIFNDKNF